MGAFRLRVLLSVILAVLVFSTNTHARDVTHEDIRDAMLSLVRMFRVSEDKLDRHEFREKAFGDQMKKILSTIEKRQRTLEPLKGMISRLDERLSNVENIFIQKEEKEKATQKKTNELLEDIQKSLQSLTTTVTKNLKAPINVENNLTTDDVPLGTRLDDTDAKLDAVKQEIAALKNSLSKEALRAVCSEVDVNPFERHISEAEKLLNKYELKLNEYNDTSKVQTDFVPLSEVSLADEAWHSKMTEVMERQEKDIKKIQQLLSDAESMWKDLPRLADLKRATNDTLEALLVSQANITTAGDSSAAKISTKIREMGEHLVATNNDIQQSLTQGNTMSERAYNDIQHSYETLRHEVQAFSKNENVMLQTADNVLANKKRIEYGVNRIVMEVGEHVNLQAQSLNKTLLDRLDTIQNELMANHSLAHGNLTAKIESEMSQVWRQIGIMYKQMTASKSTLDKLTEQTQQYVNGSATSLDDMKNKVAFISTRMIEVQENLNFLLGSLKLVTEEFSQIKTGLGEALDKAKIDLHEVRSKIKDGPGPHDADQK
ncbi:putative leucine-rich repeat-containing protein DDB_G0290503 [Pieris brassicae]|uniref:putative leucine-rich repeat-containing protein DDB_G0290503 n=1 Tax=Pieris brassicae TaxID=7116 RepID=UPI001E66164B|nr:putative leucine-rich repeat-containing protein DDB_G0290503 [Pieris brassicae]